MLGQDNADYFTTPVEVGQQETRALDDTTGLGGVLTRERQQMGGGMKQRGGGIGELGAQRVTTKSRFT